MELDTGTPGWNFNSFNNHVVRLLHVLAESPFILSFACWVNRVWIGARYFEYRHFFYFSWQPRNYFGYIYFPFELEKYGRILLSNFKGFLGHTFWSEIQNTEGKNYDQVIPGRKNSPHTSGMIVTVITINILVVKFCPPPPSVHPTTYPNTQTSKHPTISEGTVPLAEESQFGGASSLHPVARMVAEERSEGTRTIIWKQLRQYFKRKNFKYQANSWRNCRKNSKIWKNYQVELSKLLLSCERAWRRRSGPLMQLRAMNVLFCLQVPNLPTHFSKAGEPTG